MRRILPSAGSALIIGGDVIAISVPSNVPPCARHVEVQQAGRDQLRHHRVREVVGEAEHEAVARVHRRDAVVGEDEALAVSVPLISIRMSSVMRPPSASNEMSDGRTWSETVLPSTLSSFGPPRPPSALFIIGPMNSFAATGAAFWISVSSGIMSSTSPGMPEAEMLRPVI